VGPKNSFLELDQRKTQNPFKRFT